MALERIRIFVGPHCSSGGTWDLCVRFVSLYVCVLCVFCVSCVCGLSITDQVSVLNHCILVYELYIMYSSIAHVVPCYRLHYD